MFSPAQDTRPVHQRQPRNFLPASKLDPESTCAAWTGNNTWASKGCSNMHSSCRRHLTRNAGRQRSCRTGYAKSIQRRGIYKHSSRQRTPITPKSVGPRFCCSQPRESGPPVIQRSLSMFHVIMIWHLTQHGLHFEVRRQPQNPNNTNKYIGTRLVIHEPNIRNTLHHDCTSCNNLQQPPLLCLVCNNNLKLMIPKP